VVLAELTCEAIVDLPQSLFEISALPGSDDGITPIYVKDTFNFFRVLFFVKNYFDGRDAMVIFLEFGE